MKINEKKNRLKEASDRDIPGGERKKPAAIKRRVTIQIMGIA